MGHSAPAPIVIDPPFDAKEDSIYFSVRNIRIENVTASNAKSAGEIVGLPEMPISGVLLKNVNISAQTGFKIRDAKNITREDFHVDAKEGEPMIEEAAAK